MRLANLLALLFVLSLGVAAAGDRIVGEFRLNKDPNAPMRGWIADCDSDGFVFERFGNRGRLKVRWADLVSDDASRLRQRFGFELTEDERQGLMPGHELFLQGGGSVVGLLERVELGSGRHWLRVEGLLLPYPKDRIDHVEERKVKETDVYSPDELYVRRLNRRPPEDAKDHRRLADYLYEIGNWDDATEHYRIAVAKDPMLHAELDGRLAELKDYQEDKAAASVFRKAMKLANLDGRYAEAIDMVNTFVAGNPGARRRGLRILDQIEERQLEKKSAQFHFVKNQELDRSIRRYLARTQPEFDEARSWATAILPKEIEERVRERLELSDEEWELLAGGHSRGSPHWATYWGGTFIVNKHAALGKSTRRTIRGNPDDWWASYNDVNTRSTWLKAYVAERVELFEVVMIRKTPCTRCGGTGVVKKMSLKPLADGRHEWQERCPRCFGAREDRAVGYR